jgi:hypothetical protein
MALGDPTRVGIVRALANHRREHLADPEMGFAALRKAVGVRDSGRFRYHLEELCELFVEKVDAGYRLTPAGVEVATAIIAGAYTDRERLGPVELDGTCPVCAEPPLGSYEEGALQVTCANDHLLFAWGIPPNAAQGSTVEVLVELATVLAAQGIELALSGNCPECYGSMTPTVAEGGTSGPSGLLFYGGCDTCGAQVAGPLGFAVLQQPPVAAAFHRHGRSVRETRLWELSDVVVDGSLTPGADAPAEVVLRLDGEAVAVRVDESGRVVDTEPSPAEISDDE